MPELSVDAKRLARHIAHVSPDGLRAPIAWETIIESFSAAEVSTLAEAAFELERAGLVDVTRVLGPQGIAQVRPHYALFWMFDLEERGFDTHADAAHLAQLVLETPELSQASALEEHTGWPRRRLNPALALVHSRIPSRAVTREMEPNYPAGYFAVDAEVRVALRHLIEETHPENEPTVEPSASKGTVEGPATTANARLKLPFFESDLHLPNWAIGTIIFSIVAGLVFWNWPAISARIVPVGFAGETPRLVSPENGAHFTHFPRTVEFSWQPIDGAARYIVSVQAQDLDDGGWFPHPGRSRVSTEDTAVPFEFIGSQPGRWRVHAIDGAGTESQSSPWWTFSFEDALPACRHPEHGVESWQELDPITRDSGWIGGGSDPTEWCNGTLEGVRRQLPERRITLVHKSEDHKTERAPFKEDFYKYTCRFRVENPTYILDTSEHCLPE